MSQLLKQVKDLIKAEKFTLLFIVLISATLLYLLVKSPSIKTTTEIQLDKSQILDSTTLQVDSTLNDTLILKVGG